jgi:hypothetical protein
VRVSESVSASESVSVVVSVRMSPTHQLSGHQRKLGDLQCLDRCIDPPLGSTLETDCVRLGLV